jgi:hypothetical protein
MRWQDRVYSFARLIVHAIRNRRPIWRVLHAQIITQAVQPQNRQRSDSNVVVCLTGFGGKQSGKKTNKKAAAEDRRCELKM